MSNYSDDDEEELSQDDEDQEMNQQDEEDYNEQQQNAFVTDDADIQSQHQLGEFEDIEPIEARPPNEIDVDEQERRQSGTPAFRTLEEV